MTPWQSIAIATVLGLVILGAFVWLAFLSRPPEQAVSDSSAKVIAYPKIECNAPPGKTPKEFLEELRYLGLPEKITINADTDRALRGILQRHTDVEKVISITIDQAEPKISIVIQFHAEKKQ